MTNSHLSSMNLASHLNWQPLLLLVVVNSAVQVFAMCDICPALKFLLPLLLIAILLPPEANIVLISVYNLMLDMVQVYGNVNK